MDYTNNSNNLYNRGNNIYSSDQKKMDKPKMDNQILNIKLNASINDKMISVPYIPKMSYPKIDSLSVYINPYIKLNSVKDPIIFFTSKGLDDKNKTITNSIFSSSKKISNNKAISTTVITDKISKLKTGINELTRISTPPFIYDENQFDNTQTDIDDMIDALYNDPIVNGLITQCNISKIQINLGLNADPSNYNKYYENRLEIYTWLSTKLISCFLTSVDASIRNYTPISSTPKKYNISAYRNLLRSKEAIMTAYTVAHPVIPPAPPPNTIIFQNLHNIDPLVNTINDIKNMLREFKSNVDSYQTITHQSNQIEKMHIKIDEQLEKVNMSDTDIDIINSFNSEITLIHEYSNMIKNMNPLEFNIAKHNAINYINDLQTQIKNFNLKYKKIVADINNELNENIANNIKVIVDALFKNYNKITINKIEYIIFDHSFNTLPKLKEPYNNINVTVNLELITSNSSNIANKGTIMCKIKRNKISKSFKDLLNSWKGGKRKTRKRRYHL